MTVSEPHRPSVALAIFGLQPAGGLEQHCLRLARILADRGARVTLVTTRPGEIPDRVGVETLEERGLSNHGRIAAFADDAARAVCGRFDRTLAFHAIPGFDFVFCAHPTRGRPSVARRLQPRYRTYARLERAALAASGSTRVFCLSSAQLEGLALSHPGARERLLLLPPTVDARHAAPPGDRATARRALGLEDAQPVWLWMGLQPHTKGLDRALRALADVPPARLLVCGLDPVNRAGRGAQRLAERLGVGPRVRWLGFVDDAALRDALAAADLLLHPSREDVTGTVILEAMASGLPVITTDVCGYGEHVRAAGAGVVLGEPFRQADLVQPLRAATPSALADWSRRALAYGRRDELYFGLDRAADIILGSA